MARLGPRVERAFGERAGGVGNDERFIVLKHRSEAIAGGTGTAWGIKGKERGREHRGRAAARGAGGVVGKAPPVPAVEGEREACTFPARRAESVADAPPVRLAGITAL